MKFLVFHEILLDLDHQGGLVGYVELKEVQLEKIKILKNKEPNIPNFPV